MTDTPIERLRLLADFLNGPHPALNVCMNRVYEQFEVPAKQFGDDLREVVKPGISEDGQHTISDERAA